MPDWGYGKSNSNWTFERDFGRPSKHAARSEERPRALAWIDRIAVAGKIFRCTASGPQGLLKNKKAFIASARGSVYAAGSPAAAHEHQESYLIALLAFLGVTDVTVVRAEGLAFGPEAKEAVVAAMNRQALDRSLAASTRSRAEPSSPATGPLPGRRPAPRRDTTGWPRSAA